MSKVGIQSRSETRIFFATADATVRETLGGSRDSSTSELMSETRSVLPSLRLPNSGLESGYGPTNLWNEIVSDHAADFYRIAHQASRREFGVASC